MTRQPVTDADRADRVDRARKALVNGQRPALADADALMNVYTLQAEALADLTRRVRFVRGRCRRAIEQGPGSAGAFLARLVLADLGPTPDADGVPA